MAASTITITFVDSAETLRISIDTGLSAYQLAVAGGYRGTVEDWLISLNGKKIELSSDGYDIRQKYEGDSESSSLLNLSDEMAKLNNIEPSAQVNVIETVQRNGTTLPVTEKIVDISVPTKLSELINDTPYATSEELEQEAASRSSVDGTLKTSIETKENAGVAAGLIKQLIAGASASGDTLEELEDRLNVIEALVGKEAGDNDSIVNTLREVLEVFESFPEGSNVAAILSGKIDTLAIYNALDCISAGKVLDATQGKALRDLIDSLTTSLNNEATSRTVSDTTLQTNIDKKLNTADSNDTERSLAAILLELQARITALEVLLTGGNLGDIVCNSILNLGKSKTMQVGSEDDDDVIVRTLAPAIVPNRSGQIYCDQINSHIYISVNNASVSNWLLVK